MNQIEFEQKKPGSCRVLPHHCWELSRVMKKKKIVYKSKNNDIFLKMLSSLSWGQWEGARWEKKETSEKKKKKQNRERERVSSSCTCANDCLTTSWIFRHSLPVVFEKVKDASSHSSSMIVKERTEKMNNSNHNNNNSTEFPFWITTSARYRWQSVVVTSQGNAFYSNMEELRLLFPQVSETVMRPCTISS